MNVLRGRLFSIMFYNLTFLRNELIAVLEQKGPMQCRYSQQTLIQYVASSALMFRSVSRDAISRYISTTWWKPAHLGAPHALSHTHYNNTPQYVIQLQFWLEIE